MFTDTFQGIYQLPENLHQMYASVFILLFSQLFQYSSFRQHAFILKSISAYLSLVLTLKILHTYFNPLESFGEGLGKSCYNWPGKGWGGEEVLVLKGLQVMPQCLGGS